jgi:osmotically-inducible protein OsmY
MRILSAILALVLFLTPLIASSKKDAPVTDDTIYDQVHVKLAGDPDVKSGAAIEVEVHDGVVTLKGKVKTDREKDRAERLTKKVKGVKSVNNQLVVSPL